MEKLYCSATGQYGVAQRWGNYLLQTWWKCGLENPIQTVKCRKYFENILLLLLLEYFGLSYDTEKYIKEQYWKMSNTIEHGYNDN